MRKASTVLTLNASLKSEKNAAVITQAAKALQSNREPLSYLTSSFRLKNANRAIIRDEKITHYALSNSGKNKGFREILGYNESNWTELQEKILQGVSLNKAKYFDVDKWGMKYTVDIFVEGPKGKATVRTGWIYPPGKEAPELTTLYIFTG